MREKCFFVLFVTFAVCAHIYGQEINTGDVEIFGKIPDKKLSPADDPPTEKPEEPKDPSTDNVPPPIPEVETKNDPKTEIELTKGVLSTTDKMGRYSLTYNADYDPMTSWYAPPDEYTSDNYTMPPGRLEEIRARLLYPFYNQGGNSHNKGDYQDNIHQSTSQIHKNFNFQLPFFGFRFNYTRISLNGYLEFSDPPRNYPTYPLVFPVKDFPRQNDPSFIGPFYSKGRVGNIKQEDFDKRDPGVYFRLERDLRGRRDRMGVEMRERVKWDIREGIIGAENFDPKHMVVVTWKNISFTGGNEMSFYRTNTFQVVLATDEVFTYAMFNYAHLGWTTNTEAGGDPTTGEGGTPAFVGFNAGNGTRSFEYAPYSQASVIRDLVQTGWGNNIPGRHLFRIDENILMGSCNKDIDGANLNLVYAPESGSMLGGTIVNITGPCFKETDKVFCKFDTATEVNGVVVDRNRAICVQPPLQVEGYVKLEIAIGSGTYKWKGKYYVETPATAAEKIFFSDMAHYEKNPKEIEITWEKYNLTRNDNANIRISLWGYRETRIQPEFLYITELAENVQNSGKYKIIPDTYRNRVNEFLDDLKFGFIQINLTESIPVKRSDGTNTVTITPLIWSRPIPLAWYFGPQWERKYGSNWPKQLCDGWLKDDRYLKNFAHLLPQCPCTLEQALADKGRFLPDFDCDKDANPKCYFHRQAVHCVKTGSPSLQGSEQQCCYDKNNYLMLSYDQKWGSYPRRSHNLGFFPYYEPTKVPTLSQWYHDMVPRFTCCLWQEDSAVGCETLRFERRPTQDCVAYQGPGIAGVFGDPHIITYDDLQYTFNGVGEFVLVRSESIRNRLEIQGRFEQMPMNQYGEVKATQLSAIVARGNTSTVIEVRQRPKEAKWRYRMDVLADGKPLYFDRPSLKYQHFPGVTVYTPPYILNQSEVIIMFDSGAGVEVIDNNGFMSMRTYLPWSFINQTRGLFGNWSFDVIDDFTLPDGQVVATSNSNYNDMERVYDQFGMYWMLDDSDEVGKGRSLFHREFGKTSANYNNKTFRPEFRMDVSVLIPENRSLELENAYIYCTKVNYQCLYDYAMTYNREVAHFSSNYKATILQLKDTTKRQVVSCGVLEQPRFGRKDTFQFVPGTKVTFECSQDFTLVGDNQRECLANGHWNIPDYGYTECLRQQEYSKRQAGIASGVVLAVLVPIVLLLIYITYRFFLKKREDNAYYQTDEKRSFQDARQSSSPEDEDTRSSILSESAKRE